MRLKSRLQLEFAALTDTGKVRSHNEDSIALSPAFGVAVLADGMGGYNAGEVASNIATTVVQQSLESRLIACESVTGDAYTQAVSQVLQEAVNLANTAIREAALDEPQFSGMGTTLVIAVLENDELTIAHVGDSRGYRFRHDVLTQITRDHSLLQEQLDAGLISPEQAAFAQHKNLITRAVGVDFAVQAEVRSFDVAAGDTYILCSDGLTDMLSDSEIASILTESVSTLAEISERLVGAANDHGGRDNISVILIRLAPMDAQISGVLNRLRNWIK